MTNKKTSKKISTKKTKATKNEIDNFKMEGVYSKTYDIDTSPKVVRFETQIQAKSGGVCNVCFENLTVMQIKKAINEIMGF
jgi:hypothetical protein